MVQFIYSTTTDGAYLWLAYIYISASAAQREDTSLGLVCIWSKDLHRRPEFKFVASSPVLTALFHPSEEQLVLGGCYSGQILLWDMKSKSLPVQRSSMSG